MGQTSSFSTQDGDESLGNESQDSTDVGERRFLTDAGDVSHNDFVYTIEKVPYKIVHRGGIRVRANPLEPALKSAVTYDYLDIVYVLRGSELNTPEGQLLKLPDHKGWIFQKYGDMEILEPVEVGGVVREFDIIDDAESFPCWYVVTAEAGVEILEEPNLESDSILEVLLRGKIFEVSEAVTTPIEEIDGQTVSLHSFLKLKDRDGFVCSKSLNLEFCKKCAPPVTETGSWYAQVIYAGGILVRMAPKLQNVMTRGLVSCGTVVHVSHRHISAGNADVFLSIDVCNISEDVITGCHGEKHDGRIYGWIPTRKKSIELVEMCSQPRMVEGTFFLQNITSSQLHLQNGPHLASQKTKNSFQPCAVVRANRLLILEKDSGLLVFASLIDFTGWVVCVADEQKYVTLLAEFPVVKADQCSVRIANEKGAFPRKGPSFYAEAVTDKLYSCSEELPSAIQWWIPPLVPNVAPASGVLDVVQDIRWALVEEIGWFCVHDSGRKTDAVIH